MSLRADEIRTRCHPLAPVATGHPTVLGKRAGVRAVLFDVYGTLLISASGDIATGRALAKEEAFVDALAAVGIELAAGEASVQWLLEEIEAHHDSARQAGIDSPEVDIVEIWSRTLAKLESRGQVRRRAQGSQSAGPTESELRRLALEFELRVNPVWPMPGAEKCLSELRRLGLTLGLVSNAQFFTLDVLSALLSEQAGEAFSDDELQFLSYQHGRAKPSEYLYHLASQALLRRGIRCNEVLYVGNDMLNDMLPAGTIGFRTALFAGDARSLRLRKDDSRIASVTPDLVVTDLLDLLSCVC